MCHAKRSVQDEPFSEEGLQPMSYFPKKGMHRDQNGVSRFDQQPLPASPAKRWFQAEVVRRVLDSKGELVKKSRQTTSFYSVPEEAASMAVKRCPFPWPGQDLGGKLKESVSYWPLPSQGEL